MLLGPQGSLLRCLDRRARSLAVRRREYCRSHSLVKPGQVKKMYEAEDSQMVGRSLSLLLATTTFALARRDDARRGYFPQRRACKLEVWISVIFGIHDPSHLDYVIVSITLRAWSI